MKSNEAVTKYELSKYEQKTKRLIPILLEHELIAEGLDYFDDYLIDGENA